MFAHYNWGRKWWCDDENLARWLFNKNNWTGIVSSSKANANIFIYNLALNNQHYNFNEKMLIKFVDLITRSRNIPRKWYSFVRYLLLKGERPLLFQASKWQKGWWKSSQKRWRRWRKRVWSIHLQLVVLRMITLPWEVEVGRMPLGPQIAKKLRKGVFFLQMPTHNIN